MGLNLRTLSNCPSLTICDIIHVGMDLAFHISGYPDIPSLQARAPLNEPRFSLDLSCVSSHHLVQSVIPAGFYRIPDTL